MYMLVPHPIGVKYPHMHTTLPWALGLQSRPKLDNVFLFLKQFLKKRKFWSLIDKHHILFSPRFDGIVLNIWCTFQMNVFVTFAMSNYRQPYAMSVCSESTTPPPHMFRNTGDAKRNVREQDHRDHTKKHVEICKIIIKK